MGLGLVEIVMETEEEFDVTIDLKFVPKTAGELYQAIMTALRLNQPKRFSDPAYPDAVWEKLKALIAEHLGIPANSIVPEAGFVADLGCV